jgi:hypothetical protein
MTRRSDETDHDDHKRSLHRVAEHYEKMAASLEREPTPIMD